MTNKKQRTYCVYCHTCKENGKKYVGITKKKPEQRWQNGLGYKDSILFWNAIQKYGWDGFIHEILFTGLTKEEAEVKEVELIAEMNLTNDEFGYNLCEGGRTNVPNEETRKRISKTKKGCKMSEEAKCNISIGLRKYYEEHPERREKQSINGKLYHQKHPELKEHLSELGIKRYQEHPELLEEMSIKGKQRYIDNPELRERDRDITKARYEEHPELREEQSVRMKQFFKDNPDKISYSMLGKHHSEETKKKISESNKGKYHSEETKKNISESLKGSIPWNKGKHHSEETKKKISESLKGKTSWNKGRKLTEEQKTKHKGKNAKKVYCVELDKVFNSALEAELELGISRNTIGSCCLKRPHYKTAGGYHWEFVSDDKSSESD